MNFVFISPHFPPIFYNFCVQLKNAGATVLGIGDGAYDEFREELKCALTEYCQIDMFDYDTVYRTIAYFASKYGKIDRIDSMNEFWLNLEAHIRQDFNIFGQKPEDLAVNQSKLGMKSVFKKVGVPCVDAIPSFVSPDILCDFIERHGYPFIVKPDKGVGAINTYKIENEGEMDEILRDLPSDYVIEPYVCGKIVTFDGLTDRDGEIMFFASFELSENVLDSLRYQKDSFYYYARNIDPKLEKLGRKVIKGFNIRERFFHCEFFRLSNGEYCVIEINVRPPGGFSLDMQNYSCDIDLFKIWAELVVKGNDTLYYERKYNVATVLLRDHIRYVHHPKEVFKTFGDMIVEYKRIPEALAAAMGNNTFILRHPNLETLLNAVHYTMES